MNGKQTPGRYFVQAHNGLNLHILRMFEGTFSLDAAQLIPQLKNMSLTSFQSTRYSKNSHLQMFVLRGQ